MIGIIEHEHHITTSQFKDPGDAILLVGELLDANADCGLGGSHFVKLLHGRKTGLVPTMNFERELAVHEAVRALIKSRLVKSAHDCSEGGFALAVAECCLANRETPIGASVSLPDARADALLFGEAQGRIVLTTSPANATAVLFLLEVRGVPARRIGAVGGDVLKISAGTHMFGWELAALHDAWSSAISRALAA